MEKYNLKGIHDLINPSGADITLSGDIIIHYDGYFKSEIELSRSTTPRITIEGFLKHEGRVSTLLFLRSPNTANLSNIAYLLCGFYNSGYEGKYYGTWEAIEPKMEFCRNFDIFMTKLENRMKNIGSTAEVTLFKN